MPVKYLGADANPFKRQCTLKDFFSADPPPEAETPASPPMSPSTPVELPPMPPMPPMPLSPREVGQQRKALQAILQAPTGAIAQIEYEAATGQGSSSWPVDLNAPSADPMLPSSEEESEPDEDTAELPNVKPHPGPNPESPVAVDPELCQPCEGQPEAPLAPADASKAVKGQWYRRQGKDGLWKPVGRKHSNGEPYVGWQQRLPQCTGGQDGCTADRHYKSGRCQTCERKFIVQSRLEAMCTDNNNGSEGGVQPIPPDPGFGKRGTTKQRYMTVNGPRLWYGHTWCCMHDKLPNICGRPECKPQRVTSATTVRFLWAREYDYFVDQCDKLDLDVVTTRDEWWNDNAGNRYKPKLRCRRCWETHESADVCSIQRGTRIACSCVPNWQFWQDRYDELLSICANLGVELLITRQEWDSTKITEHSLMRIRCLECGDVTDRTTINGLQSGQKGACRCLAHLQHWRSRYDEFVSLCDGKGLDVLTPRNVFENECCGVQYNVHMLCRRCGRSASAQINCIQQGQRIACGCTNKTEMKLMDWLSPHIRDIRHNKLKLKNPATGGTLSVDFDSPSLRLAVELDGDIKGGHFDDSPQIGRAHV